MDRMIGHGASSVGINKSPQIMAKNKTDKPPPVVIAVVDRHAFFRTAFAFWLEQDGVFRVAWSGATHSELEAALEEGLEVDLLLVALCRDEEEGFTTLAHFREERPTLKLAAYVHRHDDALIMRAYRSGARALLHASVEGRALLSTLQAVMEDRVVHCTTSQQLLLDNPDGLTQEERNRERLMNKVSPKQLEVLEAMVRNADLTEPRIAKRMGMNPATLHSHLMDLYEIFDVNSRAALAVAAIRVGLVAV